MEHHRRPLSSRHFPATSEPTPQPASSAPHVVQIHAALVPAGHPVDRHGLVHHGNELIIRGEQEDHQTVHVRNSCLRLPWPLDTYHLCLSKLTLSNILELIFLILVFLLNVCGQPASHRFASSAVCYFRSLRSSLHI